MRRAATLYPFVVGLLLAAATGAEGCGLALVGAPEPAEAGAALPDALAPASAGEDAATPCEPSPADPRACGICGRDCGGGECRDGECTPYVIAEALPAPWYVAVDDASVYVTSHVYRDAGTGALYALPKDGGAIATLAAFGDSFDLLVDDTRIVVSSMWDESLYVLPKDASRGPRSVWDGGQTLDLARRDDVTYFTSRGPLDHGVRAVTADERTTHLASLVVNAEIEGVAVDATHVYWASRSGMIGRARRDGSERTDQWRTAPRVRRLTLDDDAVYWTSDSSAFRAAKDQGDPIALADRVGFGTIVVDARHAYITLDAAGSVVRVNKQDGTEVRVLASDLERPMGLADDGTSIYFTERDRGRIWRMTK